MCTVGSYGVQQECISPTLKSISSDCSVLVHTMAPSSYFLLKKCSQVVKFFGAVGAGLEEELASRQNERPVWLSTSGLGVYW